MLDKTLYPTKLLWIDLEMTGLNHHEDVILEIAAEVTDFNFNPLTQYETSISYPKNKVIRLLDNNPWWTDYPVNRQYFIDQLSKGQELEVAEQDLIAIVKEYFENEPAILAGNSIHSDRKFIGQYWPEFNKLLHYRMLDVSSWKIVMQGKYHQEYQKDNRHRALDDIHASIDELKYYLDLLQNIHS